MEHKLAHRTRPIAARAGRQCSQRTQFWSRASRRKLYSGLQRVVYSRVARRCFDVHVSDAGWDEQSRAAEGRKGPVWSRERPVTEADAERSKVPAAIAVLVLVSGGR